MATPKWKFGNMVGTTDDDGVYMVIGPYVGDRGKFDPVGPAVWIADINTSYMKCGDGGTVWTLEEQLVPIDE